MQFGNFPDGLYLVRQPSCQKSGIYHYAVLDVGNQLRLNRVDLAEPVLIHQTPPNIRATRFRGTGLWEVLDVARDDQGLARFQQAVQDPTYAFLWHNCEQFARFVVTGVFESKQLQAAVTIVAFSALLIAATRNAA